MALEYSYDGGFSPPAPIVPVEYSFPGQRRRGSTASFLDSGADMTVLPFGVIEELRLQRASVALVMSPGSDLLEVQTYRVRARFGDDVLLTLEVIGWNGPYAMLGRDVLNRWRVTLDGPAQRVRIDAT